MKALRLATLLAGIALVGGAAPARAVASPTAGAARAADPTVRRQDPADSLYRAARAAMGRGEYRQAESLFRKITATYPKSGVYNDAVYFQAYSLFRAGGTSDLQRARDVLRTVNDTSRDVPRALRRDALSLDTRICGELARRGDEACARVLRQRADSSGFGNAVTGVVDATVAAVTEAITSPAVARALSETQVAAAEAAREGTRAAAEAIQSQEVQRAIADAGREAARAAQEGMRAGAEALRDVSISIGGSAKMSSSSRRNPNCRDADDDERVIALNALQQMDAERAMPLLRKVLARRDECSEMLRRRAVFIVAQKKSPESAELLVSAARNDPNAEVREEAVQWLSRVGGDRAIDFLRDVARSDTSVSLRKRAVFALSQSKEARARETLRALATARETTAEVRGEALYWAIARGDSTDAEWARRLFPSLETRELKERVISSLARQRGSSAWLMQVARDSRESLEVRKSAFGYAARNATAPQLIEMWDATKEKELKESLILALSRRKEPEALDKLIAIARNDQDRDVRKSAVFWLSRSSEPRALAFLTELIDK
ncbi:HEAT repeat domain-containing protein [Roseisolibacter agri]|uniref:Outer membrane lipoprotein BamD-like domain-containing protein n=1 Tax=Roseisolibacter agri TaxID=2014610 RepID=A0AA37Q695_9BACT|nr:HEAT repeat domain-containing protein [Roseisolibacter agri]GLC25462.1 hypothetical protein rosag_19750 [Roseisolibacter agri]